MPKPTKLQKNLRTIIVTGGAGFIGSNYLNICVRRYPNYRFLNIDCLTYAANLKNIKIAGEPNYEFIKADIRDQKALEKVFKKYSPTDIIHFAAESNVDRSIVSPHDFIMTNVVGTHNLLYLARTCNIRRFYYVSTDEVYGALGPNDPSSTEISPILPNSPYSASKAAAEFIVRSYHKTYGLDAVISRCSNNYGWGQDDSKLIPRFASLLAKGKKIPLYGEGRQIRDWLYVGDHIEAIDLIFHKAKAGSVYNIGGGDAEISNLELTRMLLRLFKKNESSIDFVKDRLGHDFRYSIDCSKLKKELGWIPAVPFSRGLKETVQAYQKSHETAD